MSESYIIQRNAPAFSDKCDEEEAISQQSEPFLVNDPLSDEIAKRLLSNEDLDVSKVHVSVSNLSDASIAVEAKYLVTLSGSVVENRQREMIEALVVSCHGVAHVDNQLGVVSNGAS